MITHASPSRGQVLKAARAIIDTDFIVQQKSAEADRDGRPSIPAPPPPEGWPAPLAPEAFLGAAGRIVNKLAPHTEADPIGILLQVMVGYGNLIGRSAHLVIDGTRHFANLFVVLVGESSRGRKGTSLAHARTTLKGIDPDWEGDRLTSGLSSGEGLIAAVADRSSGNNGSDDKRLLVVESEFAGVLKNAERQGNILSIIIRQAWDDGNLRSLTKQSTTATDAHISIIAHITQTELRRYLTATEMANGFGNRFLWPSVRRSQLLPLGGNMSQDIASDIRSLGEAASEAKKITTMALDSESQDMWVDVYPKLSRDREGLLGAVTSRSEALVLRLSALAALMEGTATIRMNHLSAALELWRYCDDSARHIFGDATGDVAADRILAALRENPNSLTQNEIRTTIFAGHTPSSEINRALETLKTKGLAAEQERKTNGRPAKVWVALEGNARKAR